MPVLLFIVAAHTVLTPCLLHGVAAHTSDIVTFMWSCAGQVRPLLYCRPCCYDFRRILLSSAAERLVQRKPLVVMIFSLVVVTFMGGGRTFCCCVTAIQFFGLQSGPAVGSCDQVISAESARDLSQVISAS